MWPIIQSGNSASFIHHLYEEMTIRTFFQVVNQLHKNNPLKGKRFAKQYAKYTGKL